MAACVEVVFFPKRRRLLEDRSIARVICKYRLLGLQMVGGWLMESELSQTVDVSEKTENEGVESIKCVDRSELSFSAGNSRWLNSRKTAVAMAPQAA